MQALLGLHTLACSSLRVRLPLPVPAGNVSARDDAIAVQLFRQLARDQTLSELGGEATGSRSWVFGANNETFSASTRRNSRKAPTFAAANSSYGTVERILVRLRQSVPGENLGASGGAPKPPDPLELGRDAHLRVRAARFASHVPRGSAAGVPPPHGDRCDRRRDPQDQRQSQRRAARAAPGDRCRRSAWSSLLVRGRLHLAPARACQAWRAAPRAADARRCGPATKRTPTYSGRGR